MTRSEWYILDNFKAVLRKNFLFFLPCVKCINLWIIFLNAGDLVNKREARVKVNTKEFRSRNVVVTNFFEFNIYKIVQRFNAVCRGKQRCVIRWCIYIHETLCDVKFRQIEGNCRKFSHIELSIIESTAGAILPVNIGPAIQAMASCHLPTWTMPRFSKNIYIFFFTSG